MGTQSLSRTTTDPLAAEDSDALTETARQAMVHLRALMSSALPDSSSEPDPITDVITTRRLIAEAWTTHRWETRPTRKPSLAERVVSCSVSASLQIRARILSGRAL